MSIQEISSNFKHFLTGRDATLAALIIGVGIGSFFLGRASLAPGIGQETQQNNGAASATVIEAYANDVRIASPHAVRETPLESLSLPPEGGYVASKNGTKYHLPWCGSAKQIKEENRIWFATKVEAEAAGYTPASNCKGI